MTDVVQEPTSQEIASTVVASLARNMDVHTLSEMLVRYINAHRPADAPEIEGPARQSRDVEAIKWTADGWTIMAAEGGAGVNIFWERDGESSYYVLTETGDREIAGTSWQPAVA